MVNKTPPLTPTSPHKEPSDEGTNDENSQYGFMNRAMNVFRTPSSKKPLHSVSTPATVALTPSGTPVHRRDISDEGYLGEHEEYRIRKLFREELHQRSDSFLSRGHSFSNRRHRRLSKGSSQSVDSEGGVMKRRKSSRKGLPRSNLSFHEITPATSSSTDHTSSDSSPDRPKRIKHLFEEDKKKMKMSSQTPRLLLFMCGMVLLSTATMFWSNRTMDDELLLQYERTIRHAQRKHRGSSTAGLRGKMVQMAGRDPRQLFTAPLENEPIYHSKETAKETKKQTKSTTKTKKKRSLSTKEPKEAKTVSSADSSSLKFSPPPPLNHDMDDLSFEAQDKAMYQSKSTDLAQQRVFFFGGKPSPLIKKHEPLAEFPADFTDSTQYYGLYDSDDQHLARMEMRQPLDSGECVPMQDWQTTYHPSCNAMHELGMEQMGDESTGDNFELFGTKGFWRNAWRMDSLGGGSTLSDRESIVLKTLKYVVLL
jgi:hypothetical protein